MNNPPEHPADRLIEELHYRGWSQVYFADLIGRPYQAISEIANGKKEITRLTALQFGAALETPAEVWLHLQSSYRLWQDLQDPDIQLRLSQIRYRAER